MDEKKKAGHTCSYRDCRNKSYHGVNKFYGFPKDVER